MRNNPLTGARYLLRGFGLVLEPRIRRFVVIPLAINTLVFTILIYCLYLGAGRLSGLLESWLPDWLDWLRFLIWPLFGLVALLVMVFGFSIVGNLISAPFNGFLAEAVERNLTGRALEPAPGWSALAREVVRSVRSELRKLGYTLVRAIPILLLMWLPIVNLAASVGWVVFGAWMMAIQYADYPMANHGLSFPEQRARLAQRKMLSIGFGGAVMLALMIPILNFLVIPASVAGATAMWVEEFSESGRYVGQQER